MKTAVRKVAPRKLVDAEDAHSWETYECPVCQAPVTLRAGHSRVSYFAHKPGTGSPDCELYSPTLYPHFHAYENAMGEASSNAITLQLLLTKEGDPLGWSLELSVPTPGVSSGKIILDVGGRRQLIDLRGNSKPHREVSAEPQSKPYQIVSIETPLSTLSLRLQRHCEGLSSEGGTAFGAIDSHLKGRIQRAKRIYLNSSYAIIWPSEHELIIPSELQVRNLLERPKWKASLFHIPTEVSTETRHWLEDFTGLSIAEARPWFSPIWPPVPPSVIPSTIEAQRNTALLVALTHTMHHIGSLPVFACSTSSTLGVTSFENTNSLFTLTADTADVVELICPALTPYPIAEVVFHQKPIVPSYSRVFLEGKFATGERTSMVLLSEGAQEWLCTARRGAIELTSIILPEWCSGTLSLGKEGVWYETLQLSVFTPNILDELRRALSRTHFDFFLDFGGLGRTLVRAEKESEPALTFTLSKKARELILAYLFQFKGRPTSPVSSVNSSDDELVKAFQASSPPQELSYLHREIGQRLSALYKNITE